MIHDEDFQKWIKEIMSKIIENLGPNISDVKYEMLSFTNTVMSIMYKICITFEDKTKNQSVKLPILLKKCSHSDKKMANTDYQFYNESLFYRMYSQSNENFPKCLYVDYPNNSVIALENMNAKDYYSCPYIYDAPLEYTLAVMRELGRFHGKGYVMKELQQKKFFDIVNQIKKVRYFKTESHMYKIYINILTYHVVEYLRHQTYDPVFCDQMDALLSNAYDNVMVKTMQPLEPLSTLCHGDFILNNILFKTEGDGKYRAMLIDFALISYATPVIDLSSYLCLCCSNDIRKDRFFEIMRAYHDALKEYLQDAGIWNEKKYSYDVLLDNYKWGALFGFVIAAIFLMILKGYSSVDVEELIRMGPIDYAIKMKQTINDEISKILADMLVQLKDLGCLTKVL